MRRLAGAAAALLLAAASVWAGHSNPGEAPPDARHPTFGLGSSHGGAIARLHMASSVLSVGGITLYFAGGTYPALPFAVAIWDADGALARLYVLSAVPALVRGDGDLEAFLAAKAEEINQGHGGL